MPINIIITKTSYNMFALYIIIMVVLSSQGNLAGNGWSYHGDTGPDNWAHLSPKFCAGKKQSPINLENAQPTSEEPFEFEHYDKEPTLKLKNNGHSVKAIIETSKVPNILDGGLMDQYNFAQFHFHWGSDSSMGSEHTINGAGFPLELHFVHYKDEYKSLNKAVGHSDGLAVLGVLFKLSDTDNPALSHLVKALSLVKKSGSTYKITIQSPLSAFLPEDKSRFYRYEGGLTTPKCNEVVIWTVFQQTLPISESQLEAFRSLEDSHCQPMINNFRPVQPLNSRTILDVTTNKKICACDIHSNHLEDYSSPGCQ